MTGATGIVGCNLVTALVDGSHDVRVLVRRTSDRRGLDGLSIECHDGDVLEPEGLADAADGCDVVFHGASVFAYSGYRAEEQKDLAVSGTRNVLTAARRAGVGRAVVTSSSVVLGSRSSPTVLNETAEFEEPDPSGYTLSKVAQERAAFDAGAELGLEVITVCPTLVVGGLDYRLSPSNAAIANYLNDPFRCTFIGGCNIVSARDVAAGHILAAERGAPGCRYVLGSENLTWQNVHRLVSELTGTAGPSTVLNHTASYLAATAAEASARLAGIRPMVTRDEAKMASRFYWYSHDRVSKLGYTPMPAREALAEALAWLIDRSYISDTVSRRLHLAREVREAGASIPKEALA